MDALGCRACLKRYSQFSGKESASPTLVTIKLRSGRRSRNAATRGQSRSSRIMCSAPESCMFSSSSFSM